MSYKEKSLKRSYNGKELVPLSVGKEIIEIRDQIEANHQHAGGQWEVVYKAYSEIQEAHGHYAPDFTQACSGCTVTMNTMLKNWLALYDKGSLPQKAIAGAVKSKPLVAVKEKKTVKVAEDLSNKTKATPKQGTPSKYSTMSYGELLKEFEKKASKSEQKKINGGNKPKKAQLLEYFSE